MDCGKQPAIDRAPAKATARGVGDILALMIQESGNSGGPKCKCPSMIRKMNAWGPDGCREHRSEIVAHLLKASKATSTELPFGLDLADLLGDWVDEAIRLSVST